jgi:hypothetical protein
MNHEKAINGLYAERYLLGESGDGERADYEEHFSECAVCTGEVELGLKFLDALVSERKDKKS